LVAGTSGQTLRHNGTSWVANSIVYNNGTNVGVGSTTPDEKLEVNGFVLSNTIRSVTNASNSTTTTQLTDNTTKRYHASSQYQGASRSGVALDMGIMVELCGDEDGCGIRFLMKRWDGNDKTAAANRYAHFFYDNGTGKYRLDFPQNDGAEATDGDGGETHIYSYWGCRFSDYNHVNNNPVNDGEKSLYLLTWTDNGTNATKTCEMVVID
jgi:hypothetical protein